MAIWRPIAVWITDGFTPGQQQQLLYKDKVRIGRENPFPGACEYGLHGGLATATMTKRLESIT